MARHARLATPEAIGDGEDRMVDVADPSVPESVRRAVLEMMEPGHQLWRCPRRAGPRGLLNALLGLGRDAIVIEWWLVDAEGELVEAFWEGE